MERYEKIIEKAEQTTTEGYIEKALSFYKKAVKLEPERVEAYYGIALLYHQQGQVDRAIANFEKAAELVPNDASIFNNLGVLYYISGQPNKAEEALRQAIHLDGTYWEAVQSLAKMKAKQHKPEEVLQVLLSYGRHTEKWNQVSPLFRELLHSESVTVLVVMDQGIGNMVMLTPALRAIRNTLPKSKITVLGKYPALEVIDGWNVIDSILEDWDDTYYDIAVFTVWSDDVKRKWGKKVEEKCPNVLNFHYDDRSLHEVEYHLKFARLLGYQGKPPETYCVQKDVKLNLPNEPDKLTVGLSDTTLAHPDWERKRWPHFKELARRLIKEGHTVLLVGGPAEAKRFYPEEWPDEVIDCQGKYSIPETASIIKQCDVFVANDSGPAHIAASLGVKTLVLFGPTLQSKNLPFGSQVTAVSAYLPCSPCQYTPRWKRCSDWRCMREIDVEDVLYHIFSQQQDKEENTKYNTNIEYWENRYKKVGGRRTIRHKDITIICGASFSGTSMIAKLCLDHRAWLGDTTEIKTQGYNVFENARFRQLCRNAIGIDKDLEGRNLDKLFRDFFESLPEDKTVVLKYPKSFYLLRFFKDRLGIDFKVVFVMRNPYTRAISYQKKTNVSNFAVALQEWNEAYINLSQKTQELDVYLLLYERFFVEPELETKKLLDFIGIKYNKIDISSIDLTKRHF